MLCSVLLSLLVFGDAIAEVDDLSLAQKLRQGGYVVLMRHAITDYNQFDMNPVNLENCEGQRNLSQAGRDQSAAIGQAIRSLSIPVGKVYSSQFCRCIETAELAFGKYETRARLSSYMQVTDEEKIQRVNYIKELLGTPPEQQTNTFLITHSYMLQQASGIALQEGWAAVFKPDGDGQFQFIATISSSRWQTMVNSISQEELNPN